MTLAMTVYKTVHDFKGGASALAPVLGCGESTLRNKVNPNLATHHLTLEEADKLMAATGDYSILHALNARHGFVGVCADVPDQSCDMAVLELVTKVWRTNGDIGRAVDETLADGRVERCEVRKVRSEVYRMQQALQHLLMRLEGMAQ